MLNGLPLIADTPAASPVRKIVQQSALARRIVRTHVQHSTVPVTMLNGLPLIADTPAASPVIQVEAVQRTLMFIVLITWPMATHAPVNEVHQTAVLRAVVITDQLFKTMAAF